MERRENDQPLKTALRIQLLGGFSVAAGEAVIPAEQWKSRRARSLVKLLALAPGHRLHRDQVMDTLWPDSDLTAAANNLHQTLFGARKILEGAGELVLEDGFLSLTARAGQALVIDVEQFEKAAAGARDGQDPAVFQSALAIYTGDLLPEDRYEEWTIERRNALRQAYLKLLLDLARLHETREEYPQGIEVYQRLLSADKSHEEAHAGLMRLYALSGQRQQALRQYQTLRQALREELDAEPGAHTTRLYETIQSGQLAGVETSTIPQKSPAAGETPPAEAPRSQHNLPYRVSTFVGREQEIDRVIVLLHGARLLTITGAGGVGKTSLTIRVAEYLLPSFQNGVWLVELASLTDPALIAQTCAQALGMIEIPGQPVQQALIGYLAKKRVLLILDNCEHLLAGCAAQAQGLLSACPGLAILATSREPLGVSGETIYRLPSLAVPQSGNLSDLAALAQVEAVRLFIERAAQVSPDYGLTPANAGAVAQICRQLDGIPLAIELAAARVRMLNAEQIAACLDNAFQVLTGGSKTALPRQRTLKATIDWSYDLLVPKEQLLFQRLSVFSGGWTLEAAEAVCADRKKGDSSAASAAEAACEDGELIDAAEVLDLLGNLVDKSLVLVETGETENRYRLLETIRQYAGERLLESGCGAAVRSRHLAYFSQMSGEAEPHLRGKGQLEWLARLDDELDNLRAAAEWALGTSCSAGTSSSAATMIEQGLKMMADLRWYWHIRGLFDEALDRLKTLLAAEAQARTATNPTGERAVQRARALRAVSELTPYGHFMPPEENAAIMEESVRLLRAAGAASRRELGISLFYLLYGQESLDHPSPERDEMLAIFEQEQERFYLSEYYFNLPAFMIGKEEWEPIIAYEEKSLALCREIEDLDGIASRLYEIGVCTLQTGAYRKAEALLYEAIVFCRKVKNRWFEQQINAALLWTALAQGNYTEVDRLAEACLFSYREINYRHGIIHLLIGLMQSAWSQGDYRRVQNLASEIGEMFPDNPYVQTDVYRYSGRAALSQDDLPQAEVLLKKALAVAETNSDQKNEVLLVWPCLWIKQGKPAPAARLLGALARYYRLTAPGGFTPRERSEHDEALAEARSALSEKDFAAAWKAGEAMTMEQAEAFVLAEVEPK